MFTVVMAETSETYTSAATCTTQTASLSTLTYNVQTATATATADTVPLTVEFYFQCAVLVIGIVGTIANGYGHPLKMSVEQS